MSRLAYLRALIVFAFAENPALYLCVSLSVLSVLTELAAMSSLLPLLSIASNKPLDASAWTVRVASWTGIDSLGEAVLIVFLSLFALRVATQFANQALSSWISKCLLAQLATRAFATLVEFIPIREVERTSIGAFITLVGDESFRASTVVTHLNQAFSTAFLAAVYFAAIVYYSPAVALAVLLFLLITVVALSPSFPISHRLGTRQVEQSQAAGSLFLDALNGLRSVRAFSAEKFVSEAYRLQMWEYIRTLFRVDAVSILTRLLPALLLLGAVAIFAASQVGKASITKDLPFLVTIVVFLMRFFPTVGQALQIALRVAADSKAGRDVTHLVSFEAPDRRSGSGLGTIADIEGRELSFAHRQEQPVLQDLNFRLEKGKSYAIVGVSGSGKSTLLDLLLGFYQIESGQLLINGKPLKDIAETELRRRILLVSQSTSIFNDTVANNVRFGFEADLREIEQACRSACADEFIRELPGAYGTTLMYQGANLSGGQRQRIGIARAVLRRPDVLLLDESTSALDGATREALVANLIEQFGDRILVFVTHDPYICARVDEVLNMAVINKAHTNIPESQEVVQGA